MEKQAKELQKRRVYLFFAVFLLISIPFLAIEESDKFTHALDEYVLIIVALVVTLSIILLWKNNSSDELSRQHNLFLILFLIALIFKIIAIFVEKSDPEDFGNEIPLLIFVVMAVINRFF